MAEPHRIANGANTVPKATPADTARVLSDVLLPFAVRGPIARRPRMVGFAERVDADARAVRRLRDIRGRYGPGPVRIELPGRTLALILAPEHVHRVLEESPEPFATANLEKRAALGHFQPEGVLISEPAQRTIRKPFNDRVLEAERPVHSHGTSFTAKITEEAELLAADAQIAGRLSWDAFITAWWRGVRRVVLGDAARDDSTLTDMLTRLRHDANFSYLKPKRTGLRLAFQRRLRTHLQRAEAGSLAELVTQVPADDPVLPHQQVPQWLFAFDAAGMAAMRAAALIAAHPHVLRRVRDELGASDLSQPHELPLLRGALLESLRLWPTTPAVLRDTTRETQWDAGALPAGAGIMIFAPLFHRDPEALSAPDGFTPDLWLAHRTADDWPLIPFSGGPGMCPGRNLVLLTTTAMLGTLHRLLDLEVDPPNKLLPDRPLPGTLSPFHLRLRVQG